MTEQEYTQRLFGTPEDGVLYLAGPVMREAKIKPGDKLRIILDKEGLRVQKADNIPRPGGQP
ncbi:MAG: hypothetical protein ACREBU_13965 [Nitrososphaera sp.]